MWDLYSSFVMRCTEADLYTSHRVAALSYSSIHSNINTNIKGDKMSFSWQTLIHRCLEVQLQQFHDGTFDPKAAMQSSPESSWNSCMCASALSILHQYVDALYFTSKPPTDFSRLEKIFVDSMQLEVHPEVRGDRLYLFGQSKPCIRLPQLQQALGLGVEQEAAAATTTTSSAASLATVCHEVRLCVLLAALAICQMSLTSQYARGFALMVKAILGEARVAEIHATSELVQQIAKLLGDSNSVGRVLDMLDAAFDAMAQHSLQRLEASSAHLSATDRGGSGGGSTTPLELTPRAAAATSTTTPRSVGMALY